MVEKLKQSSAAQRRLTDAEIDAQIPGATAREEAAHAAGLRATSAVYDRSTQRVVLELSNGTAFAFPAAIVHGLESATADQRAALELSPSGSGVLWDALDADISVPGILAATFRGSMAAAIGKVGGKSRSEAKAKAAKANGAKGGRPRKRLLKPD